MDQMELVAKCMSLIYECTAKPYSDEWWDAMTSALVFLPEEQRQGFMDILVMAGAAM